ncbi:hypothetical protein [Streptomyces spiramenti]|uniref:ATP-binding protein n=1 Tax=Streptomyces spiramenti TaxID=2720606 RepID=A0ABX1AVR4_9ACTN|nr:hypothetical protein [Streptomyces spiramenti]NJP68352.1 hypothetical protein [Streptomyces spiramenti]
MSPSTAAQAARHYDAEPRSGRAAQTEPPSAEPSGRGGGTDHPSPTATVPRPAAWSQSRRAVVLVGVCALAAATATVGGAAASLLVSGGAKIAVWGAVTTVLAAAAALGWSALEEAAHRARP